MDFRRLKTIITLATIGLFLSTNTANAQHGQYVGGDISLIPSYEASNNIWFDKDGNKINDLLSWLKNECGWNCFRVRLFVNPQKLANDGKTFDPAVCQDLDYVKKLGKRIKDLGAKFMLDIHYSDTYVDATHIQAPAECNGMTVDQKVSWMTTYTGNVLATLKEYGATPDLVQVGNEIMAGVMGVSYSSAQTDYLNIVKAGCAAVRTNYPQAKIIIHTDKPCDETYTKKYYQTLDNAGVDYDIIGLSYYPFWHGWLTTSNGTGLVDAVKKLAVDFPTKKVQIVETAYNFQETPSGMKIDTKSAWPYTPEGQYKFVCDMVYQMGLLENVNGLMYWCPEEAGNGDGANWTTKDGVVLDPWLNRGLWASKNDTQSGSLWGHKPNNEAKAQYELKKFLDPTITSVSNVNANVNVNKTKVYTISGQYIGDDINKISTPGLYISGGKKISIH